MTNANFFVPGPTWVRPEILQEMLHPMIAHRSPQFGELFERVVANLKPLFGTTQDTFVATCSGTALLEAALTNCVPRRLLVTTCGAFGERWHAIAGSLGLEVDQLNAGWGNAVEPAALADHLASRRTRYNAVTLTHNETSTGVTNDLAALARVVHTESPDTLVLVDAVSSLGAIPVQFDEWGLDVCLASVQKGIAIPPGITVFAVSARALDRCKKRPYRGTYLDFLNYKKHADDGNVPTTPSIPHFYALARQLDDIIKVETLHGRYRRHAAMRETTIRRTAAYAELAAADIEHASATVSALVPDRPPDELRTEMKKRGFTLGGGYGKWKATTLRIGHMGDIQLDDLNAMLDVLEQVAAA
ncbi:MAG TPA: alanine--glyoxylate aminotransferase family protein [Thermoanaerobaculia bacterium]|jgi:aspartate aminotransferase-like enzyme|nr:alanine--glyoxylate aminotransferase family protein [Thermoanaerobaculia bacterium]